MKGTAEDRPSLGLFGLLRKDSAYGKQVSEQAKSKTKLKVTFNLQKNQTRKASKDQDGKSVRLFVSLKHSSVGGKDLLKNWLQFIIPLFFAEEKFLELLSRAQSSRMDDQRGLGTSTSEIPEFLRSKMEYPSGRESAPPILKQDSSKREGVIGTPENYVQNNNKYFASYTRGQVATRPSSVPADSFLDHSSSRGFDSVDESQISHEDQSFSADGVIPSSSEAEVYFQTTDPDSADFDDPRLAEKGLRDLGFDYSYNMYQAKAWGYSRHRPTGLSSPRHQSKGTPNKPPMATVDRFSFDETSMMDSSKDMDKTLVGSPLEGRPASLPPALDRNSPRTSFSPVMSSRPFGIYMRNSVGENSVSHSTPKTDPATSRYSNHKSAFRAPGAGTVESPVAADMSGDLNESQKAMIIDMGSSDENVTFV